MATAAPSRRLKYCASVFEAAFLKEYLVSNGVEAWYDGEDSLGFTGRYSILARGVALRVRPGDFARAVKLLKSMPELLPEEEPEEAVDDDAEQRVGATPPACPNCGSENTGQPRPPRWLVFLLIGLPLLLGGGYVCGECGWTWKE
jgi:hypothetical protein